LIEYYYIVIDDTENSEGDSRILFHGEILHLTHNPSWTLSFPKSFGEYSFQYDDLEKIKGIFVKLFFFSSTKFFSFSFPFNASITLYHQKYVRKRNL